MPRTIAGRAIGGQLVRAGTSVGANYRAACRSRSKAEFIARLGVVEEEADESGFWLETIIESELMKPKLIEPLMKEASELVAIMTSSGISAAGNKISEKVSLSQLRVVSRSKSKIKN